MKKEKTTISVDVAIMKYMHKKVEDGTFANVSHGFEYCARAYMRKDL